MSTGAADRVLRRVRRGVETAVVILFALLTVAVFVQVVARYVFNQPPAWTEEVARFCQVWIILLAASICIRKGSHLAVDYLGPALPPEARRAVALFTGILVALYAAVVVIWGTRLAFIGSLQTSPALQLNMGWVYLVFPLSGGLMLLEALLALRRPEPSTGSEAP